MAFRHFQVDGCRQSWQSIEKYENSCSKVLQPVSRVYLCLICFFSACSLLQYFWKSIQPLFGNEVISEVEVIFGITRSLENSVLYNHLILLSKRYIFSCKFKITIPLKAVFLTKVKALYETERRKAKESNKLSIHYKKKWNELLTGES